LLKTLPFSRKIKRPLCIFSPKQAGETLNMYLSVTGEDVIAVSPTVYIREYA
jgi:hypothetical protein